MSQGNPSNFARHGSLTSSHATRKPSHTRGTNSARSSSRPGMKSNIPNTSARRVTNRATAFDMSRFEQLHLNATRTTTQSVIDREISPDLPHLARPDSNVANTNPNRAIGQITASGLSRFAFNSPSKTYLALRNDLVKQLNPQSALIRDTYDPTTIAHDILIAADKHPVIAGLNSHLIPLRSSIDVIRHSSDLATIRWDIIDPEIMVSSEPSAQQPVTPPRTPVSKDIYHSPDIGYLSPPRVVVQSPPTLERNASTSDIEQVDDDISEPVVIQTSPTPTRGSTSNTTSTGIDAVSSPRENFQCEWTNCHHPFSDIWSFRLHVARHHVLVNLTCGWANCDCDLYLSGFDLWEHVEKAHIESPG